MTVVTVVIFLPLFIVLDRLRSAGTMRQAHFLSFDRTIRLMGTYVHTTESYHNEQKFAIVDKSIRRRKSWNVERRIERSRTYRRGINLPSTLPLTRPPSKSAVTWPR